MEDIKAKRRKRASAALEDMERHQKRALWAAISEGAPIPEVAKASVLYAAEFAASHLERDEALKILDKCRNLLMERLIGPTSEPISARRPGRRQ